MKRRILITLTITLLAISTNVMAQGYIPECRAAKATLVQYSMLSTVGQLVKWNCPQIHANGWLLGQGIADKDGICVAPWNAVAANATVYNAAGEFVTRTARSTST